MKRVAILGSTGSIGVNALQVAASLKEEVEVVALSADSNIKLLARQANIFKPKSICVVRPGLGSEIKPLLPQYTSVLTGEAGLKDIVSRPDVDAVLFAISGTSCLIPLIEAIKNKKTIALANKEAMVSAGSIIMKLARDNETAVIPIDSEHSAIFQCLENKRQYLDKIYLTATGGPLLNVAKAKFDKLRPKFILNHPKWKMGKKISVDSATLMNKGLEVIEAKWLFDVDEKAIQVLVHPEAIIHSMIELFDHTIFALLSSPDMRIPIQYALTFPDRLRSTVKTVDFSEIKNMSFRMPDLKKFPCLALAREALRKGSTYPAVLNVADEVAVGRYLEGRIQFTRIPYIIEKVIGNHRKLNKGSLTIEDICAAQDWAREEANKLCH